MSRIESASAVSQQLGAGCAVRASWPNGNAANAANASARASWGAIGNTSLSGVSQLQGVYDGRVAVQLPSTVTPTGAFVGTANAVQYGRERPGSLIQTDVECFAFRATLAWPAALGGALGTGFDCGLVVMQGVAANTGTTGGVNYGPNGGISFGPSSVNTVRWMMRNDAGAITVNVDVTPSGFDYLKWNTFEIRLIGGTPSTDPYAQGFIAGVPVTQKYSCTSAAGLFCDPIQSSGNVKAYCMAAANLTNGACPVFYLHSYTVAVGRTESDLY